MVSTSDLSFGLHVLCRCINFEFNIEKKPIQNQQFELEGEGISSIDCIHKNNSDGLGYSFW